MISRLCETSIDHSEGHSRCVCGICKTWEVILEKALAEIITFKTLAISFQSALKMFKGALKI